MHGPADASGAEEGVIIIAGVDEGAERVLKKGKLRHQLREGQRK